MTDGAITGTPTTDRSGTSNAFGNWVSTTTSQDGGDAVITNDQNELTGVGDNSQSFDADGNTLVGIVPGPSGTGSTATMTYNAWNEMTSATVGGTTEIYKYNALGQRIAITQGSTVQVQYYSMSGQVIETDAEPTGGTLSPQTQYVWGLDYFNDLVERDDNSTSGYLGATGSGLGRRIYAMTDANYDVIAVADATGNVLEKFDFAPYGAKTTFFNSAEPGDTGESGSSATGSATDTLDMQVGFQGGMTDSLTGLIHLNNNSDYNSNTGDWTTQPSATSTYTTIGSLYDLNSDNPTTVGGSNWLDPTNVSVSDPNSNTQLTLPTPSQYIWETPNPPVQLTPLGHLVDWGINAGTSAWAD